MPELLDGQSVEIQGSASRPYVLKNIGGVYSCSCPAWRNQSLPIDRRSCKHLRQWLGEAEEAARLGSPLSATPKASVAKAVAPPLLLAESWDGTSDPSGWLVSEKLDGVRAYWDGTRFLSRQGNRFFAPEWFTAGLPSVPLDGELWIGRKQFQRTVSIVRRQEAGDLWQEIRYRVFDAPTVPDRFEQRLEHISDLFAEHRPRYAQLHEHSRCRNAAHVREELARVLSLGGEGLMLRQPGSRYEAGRSSTLLKIKQALETEARVIGHQPGTGKHRGRLGALLAVLPDGTQFAVGTGFTDAQREAPPPIGQCITFRYQELTDGGVPRFPSFVGVRDDEPVPKLTPTRTTKVHTMPRSPASVAVPTAGTRSRRFEFVQGSSDKFWEVAVNGPEVTVRWGRNGTQGQTQIKPFADSAQAQQHAEKLIRDKTGKGYVEVA